MKKNEEFVLGLDTNGLINITAECQTNPRRFEKAIMRCKEKNFRNDALKTKIERKDQKIREVRCSRDIVSRLLFLAARKNLTSLKFSAFLLLRSHCHFVVSGNMNKTDKSALVKKLEAKRTANAYTNTGRCIHSRRHPANISCELCPTFGGGIAFVILQKACTHFKTFRIVCDTYKDVLSINGYKQEQTGSY